MFDQYNVFKSNTKDIKILDRFISFKTKNEIKEYIKSITNGNVLNGFQSCHFGQRKLLLSEIMFLLYTQNKGENKFKKVVYAGAAPCDHIFVLTYLFPNLHFDLFDPAKWNDTFCKQFPDLNKLKLRNEPISTYIYNNNITIHHGYFTDEIADYYANLYKNEQVLFISDIRPVDNFSKEEGNYLNWEKVVVENMEEQKRWHIKFHTESNNPENNWTLLKFKPTFEIPLQSYLKGDLFYQPFAPLLSAECRLITNSIEEVDYDCIQLEKLCFYHNTYTRNVYHHISDYKLAKLFNSYFDTKYEYELCLEYRKQYPNEFNKKFKTIFDMMIYISESLGKYGGFNKYLNLYPFQKGYRVAPFLLEKWVNKLVELNNNFDKE